MRATHYGPRGFQVIGAMKLASTLLLCAAGLGIFRLLHSDLGSVLQKVAGRMHLDPENRLVHELIYRLAGIDHKQLIAIGAGTFFYAILHFVEGLGLILRRLWAGYLTIVATGALLPVEVYELARKVTLLRAGVLVVNLVILAYVIIKLRQEHRARTEMEPPDTSTKR